ncbi:MAG: RNA ligase partner protein [Candidatus Omnitrophota bacterium]|nr:MAG: RNA ligase partner protein [Candidatus Omnitrophota bacterium]
MKVLKIVLDTSLFVNPDARYLFGQTPKSAFSNFLDALKSKKNIHCYIPPSVYRELMKFVEGGLPSQKTILINKKPPSSYDSAIPALFVYEFIEEFRMRINKGLRIGEKYSRKALHASGSNTKEEEIIKHLREEYRVALREGIIDSKEDFDLLLLARELNAHLATSDSGLIEWAQKLGIPCLSAQELKELLSNCA